MVGLDGEGLKTTSAGLGVSRTEVRCMLGGLDFEALGLVPSTIPDARPGLENRRLLGTASRSGDQVNRGDGWAGQGPGLALWRQSPQKYDTSPDESG